MNAAALVERATNAGVRVWADGDKLRFKPGHGTLPPELIEEFRQSKPEVMALLRARATVESAAVYAGLPVEVAQTLPAADALACDQFATAAVVDYLRARAKRYGLTVLQWQALAILKADPAQRRAFIGEPTPEGYRLAVAIRRPDGEIVVGEMILPADADPLRAITSCPP